MVCQWFGANGSRALLYDMVPFILAALLHARTHTDDLMADWKALIMADILDGSFFYGPWTM